LASLPHSTWSWNFVSTMPPQGGPSSTSPLSEQQKRSWCNGAEVSTSWNCFKLGRGVELSLPTSLLF
jgi:hypothetical protein